LKRADFKFIYIYSTNPAVVLPGQKDVREGLEHKDVFTAVHETHWTETADRADVVLPATSFLEKRDIVLPWSHRHVRLSEKVIEPLGESRDETWVMQELARRLGLEESWLYEDPWHALERAFEGALDDGTFEDLTGGKDLLLKPKPREEYRTPSGKLEFYSGVALTKGLDPLPQHRPRVPGPGEFFLINTATRHYTNTQFREEYGPIPAEVTINPVDADKAGVAEGETVSLRNELGSIDLVVKLSESVPTGVLWAPRQLTDPAGRPMNNITSPDPQPAGGGPTFNSTIVTVIKK
jgi:anaerobic selenocysteine-containing dehydrogenase